MFVHFIIILCAVAAFCDTAAVESSIKCGINDGPCQIKVLQQFLRDLSKDGGADGGADGGSTGIDPYRILNLPMSIPDIINATILEGSVKGMKDCIISNFKPNIQAGRATLDMACEHIIVKGRYMFSSTSPAVKALFGTESISGDGNAKIKMDGVSLSFILFYKVVERNGDIYIALKGKKVDLVDIKVGKTTFKLDSFYLGKEESSAKVVDLLNENSQLIINVLSKPFGRKLLGTGMEYVGQLLTSTPAKNFIIDDLTPYVH